MQAQDLHLFSFFSGSGFLDLGFEEAGFIIDSVNEFSPTFQYAYQYARKRMGISEPRFKYSRDINDFLRPDGEKRLKENIKTVRNEGHLIGFIGGPPCPDFSVAGKQKGRDGNNGKLSQSYIDLIYIQKPDFFLFENVKGLWRTAKHRAYFEELKAKLSKYYDLTNRLCNSLEYGVPQDRDRILLFGIKRTVAKKLKLNIDDFDWKRRQLFNLDNLKSLPWPEAEPFVEGEAKDCPAEIPAHLQSSVFKLSKDLIDSIHEEGIVAYTS